MVFVMNKVLILLMFLPVFCQGSDDVIIKNKGQIFSSNFTQAEDVIYYFKGEDFDVFFQQDKISYVFNSLIVHEEGTERTMPLPKYSSQSYRLDMEFLNAKTPDLVEGFPIELNHQYIIGKELKVQTNYGFTELVYKDIYNGIDLRFYFENNRLKYDFVVAPGANHTDIKFQYVGAESVEVSDKLINVRTPLGNLKESIPETYQVSAVGKKRIDGNYKYSSNQVISFDIKEFNQDEVLIIDPWSTFIGGNDIDESYGIHIDSKNNTYVAGNTRSVNFPVTAGVLQTTLQGLYDAFLTKLDPSGNGLWSTFYGASGDEFGYDVVVDANDNPYLIGYTNANDILVSSSGVFQSVSNGSYDGFIIKFDSVGNFLWGTYYGGSGGELVLAADIDTASNIVIGGYTSSMDMPVLNAHQTSMGGALDAFVAKFDSTGNLIWSTYKGGSNSEDVHALHVDQQNNVIIAGETFSNDFPASSGAYQVNNAGNNDIFLAKFSAQGVQVFATYFGGFNREDAYGLCSDNLGKIFLAGYTESLDFPMLGVGIYQPSKSGGKDGFVAKFSANGIPYKSTYIGGTSDDIFKTAQLSITNALYLGGNTTSSDLPMIGLPYQNSNLGLSEGMYFKLDTSLTPNYSTYFGGSSAEYVEDLYVNSGILTFSGFTSSSNFPTTSNVFQDTIGGQSDAFVFQTDSIFNFTTNISDQTKEHEIFVYPNPTSGFLNISFGQLNLDNMNIILFNIIGSKVLDKEVRIKEMTMDFNGLKPGVYFLNVYKDQGLLETIKVIRK
jgi:hypothetical protein